MYEIIPSNQFKKDIKSAQSRGYNMELIREVIKILASGEKLPPKYRAHQLIASKKYKDVNECHIQPDWLLIYKINNNKLMLYLLRTGTHSDLF